jgi:integrase
MVRRRGFGTVRQRESGKWQVRYLGPDGLRRAAPQQFVRKSDAEQYLRLLEARMVQGDWIDPRLSRVKLSTYADAWIDQRPGLRARSIENYKSLLKNYIKPTLGYVPIGKIDPPLVREWRASLLDRGASPLQVAKAYRLLHAVLATAADEDRLIRSNPCRVRGASAEKSPERPALTVDQVYELADLVPKSWRAFILVKTFGSLRWGEITALARMDVNFERSTIRVRRQLLELRSGAMQFGPPKSRAGDRTVSLPISVMAELKEHLDTVADPQPDALVFTALAGQPMRRSNFNKSVDWKAIVAKIGVPELHLHDLRHAGNTLAASTGASLRDLMAQMGHDSPAAALIYQHATSEADTAIALALEAKLRERRAPDSPETAPPAATLGPGIFELGPVEGPAWDESDTRDGH